MQNNYKRSFITPCPNCSAELRLRRRPEDIPGKLEGLCPNCSASLVLTSESLADKLVLVTGACGFVGGHMVDLLLRKGYRVRATDLKDADRSHIKKVGVEFIPSDLTDKSSLKKVFEDVDYVFNPASLFSFWASWDALKKVNIDGMRNICEVALDSDVEMFVHWSTVGVYGIPDPKYFPIKEDAPKRPATKYEKSKWEQEKIGFKFQRDNGLPLTALRPAPIYGPRSFYGGATGLFMLAKGQIVGLPLATRGYNRAPAVHVKDVVGAAYFLSQNRKSIGEAYNIVDDSTYTIRELLKFSAPLVGAKIYPIYLPTSFINLGAKIIERKARRKGIRPSVEPDTIALILTDYWFSNEKIKALGYKLQYPDLKIGTLEIIDWYKSKGLI